MNACLIFRLTLAVFLHYLRIHKHIISRRPSTTNRVHPKVINNKCTYKRLIYNSINYSYWIINKLILPKYLYKRNRNKPRTNYNLC